MEGEPGITCMIYPYCVTIICKTARLFHTDIHQHPFTEFIVLQRHQCQGQLSSMLNSNYHPIACMYIYTTTVVHFITQVCAAII